MTLNLTQVGKLKEDKIINKKLYAKKDSLVTIKNWHGEVAICEYKGESFS